MSRQHCLDDPTKPNKAFRAVLVQRKPADKQAVSDKLTPRLKLLFVKYQAKGTTAKELSAATEQEMLGQLGQLLNDALDGILDLDAVQCRSCDYTRSEKDKRLLLAAEPGAVRCVPGVLHQRACTAAASKPCAVRSASAHDAALSRIAFVLCAGCVCSNHVASRAQ